MDRLNTPVVTHTHTHTHTRFTTILGITIFFRSLCFSLPCFPFYEFTLFQINLLKIFMISIITFHPKHRVKYYFGKQRRQEPILGAFSFCLISRKAVITVSLKHFLLLAFINFALSTGFSLNSFSNKIFIKFFLYVVADLIPNWFMFLYFCYRQTDWITMFFKNLYTLCLRSKK